MPTFAPWMLAELITLADTNWSLPKSELARLMPWVVPEFRTVAARPVAEVNELICAAIVAVVVPEENESRREPREPAISIVNAEFTPPLRFSDAPVDRYRPPCCAEVVTTAVTAIVWPVFSL